MAKPTRIHVAAESERYRESLRITFESLRIADVVVASPEGEEGVSIVRNDPPEILVVSTALEEDTIEHLKWYRKAAPDAFMIGFAFNEHEAMGLEAAGIERVVMSSIPRADLIAVLRDAARRTA